MITFYYKRFRHLRIAQPIVNDIEMLRNISINFRKSTAISAITSITTKYEEELQYIGFYLSGRPVVKGEIDDLYSEYEEDSFLYDIDYLIDCLCIIGAVRFGVEKSLDDAIENVLI
jgi:hypothetical protein